jgi:integrase
MRIDKKQYLYDSDLFATLPTVERIVKFFIELGMKNGYVIPFKRLIVRFVNFIRKEKGLPPIEYKLDLQVSYSHVNLTDEEIQHILNFDSDKWKYIECQSILKINAVVGLRINELLTLYAEDVVFKKDHVLLMISENKNNKSREVVIVDQPVIALFEKLVAKVKTGKLFSLNKDAVNYHIQRIAMNTGKFNSLVKKVSNNGKNTLETRVPKWKCLSTHSFRRYRIIANAKEHGLLVAKYYSGHSNLNTIQRHYLGEISHEEVIKKLAGK